MIGNSQFGSYVRARELIRPVASAAILISLHATCAGPTTGESSVVRRDSAGIEIVMNNEPAWDHDNRWFISPQPTLSIGNPDGDSAAAFSRIAGAFRDRSGRIIVLDALAQELRFFGPDGAFQHSTGGPGEGPGEFTSFLPYFPSPIHDLRTLAPWRGDSIVVHGMRRSMLQILDAEGVERRRIQARELARWVQAAWGADRILISNNSGDSDGPSVDGWTQGRLFAFSVDGTVDDLGLHPLKPENDSGAYGAYGFWAPTPEGFVSGISNRAEIKMHDWEGNLRRIVRLPIDPEPVPDSIQIGEGTTGAVLPIIYRVATDHEGYLWIASRPAQIRSSADALHVVARDGRYLGIVALPAGFHPVDIGSDWILGIWRDEFDVEYLRLHTLDRRSTRE